MNKQEFLKSRVGGISDISVRELVLFAKNDSELYQQTLKYINSNMGKSYKDGRYDLHKAVVAYRSFMDRAAKAYAGESSAYGQDGVFTSAEKWAAAYEMAEDNLAEMKLGNFTE